jgi:hypothetical protein
MRPRPARFRPHLERLEDRHLPRVAVSFGGGTLTLAAATAADRITVFNDGRGHITGSVTGFGALNDPTTQDGFFDVRRLEIFTAGGGAEFHQAEDGFNPSGSQVDTLALNVHLGNRADSFTADLHGHAIHGGMLALAVFTGRGAADVRVKAAGVNIFGGLLSAVFVGGPGEDRFSMNWSGVKAGTLRSGPTATAATTASAWTPLSWAAPPIPSSTTSCPCTPRGRPPGTCSSSATAATTTCTWT